MPSVLHSMVGEPSVDGSDPGWRGLDFNRFRKAPYPAAYAVMGCEAFVSWSYHDVQESETQSLPRWPLV